MRSALEFHHHPDGIIYVKNGIDVYQDTLENFTLDIAPLKYDGLPQNCGERLFVPDKCHFTRCPASIETIPRDLKWVEGSVYISMCKELIGRQAVRRGSEAAKLAAIPDPKRDALNAIANKLRNAQKLTDDERDMILAKLLGI